MKTRGVMSDHQRSHIIDSVLATPVVAGFFMTLAGVSLQSWLIILSIAYTVLLIIQKLWQMRAGPVAFWRFLACCFRRRVPP